MKRRTLLGLIALAIVVPATANAKIDMTCSTTTATSAIGGMVKNAKGQAVPGMRVELSLTNNSGTLPDSATTDAAGRYRICAGQNNSMGHNTYDVHVRDLTLAPLYATANQPYSTYANFSDADFTPDSGYPLLYLANLTITPNAISTVASAVGVTWVVRAKAPAGTVMKLTLGHRANQTVGMLSDGIEGGGPGGGGWTRWKYTDTIAKNSTETLYWASARGYDSATQTTQMDRQPYVIDNKGPIIGPAGASITECGPGVTAGPFSPASPPGTTNPMPIVTHGVCDHWSNGARSGLNPFSLTGKMCRDAALTLNCQSINPVLNTFTIVWYPSAPLAKGDFYFQWRIADYAGNVTTNPTGYRLTITDKGGQTPTITGVQPGNVGSGTSFGVVVGSSLTSPNSYPSISFKATDADGQRDLVPGTLQVRVYYMTEQPIAGLQLGLVYEYDAFRAMNDYDPVSKKGGGAFDLSSGGFRATGYPLLGKPPGRYIATASITDYGGNSATLTWQWILAAAI